MNVHVHLKWAMRAHTHLDAQRRINMPCRWGLKNPCECFPSKGNVACPHSRCDHRSIDSVWAVVGADRLLQTERKLVVNAALANHEARRTKAF